MDRKNYYKNYSFEIKKKIVLSGERKYLKHGKKFCRILQKKCFLRSLSGSVRTRLLKANP